MTPEPLDAGTIVARLSPSSRIWLRDLQIHEELDSTNSHLMRTAAMGVDGVVCLTENQTRGRGRRGRSWLSRPGHGVALSLGRRMSLPISRLAPITLVAGVAVAQALRDLNVAGVGLKWPNDVLINGVKAGGILVEVAGIAEPHLVIGVGINIGARDELEAELSAGIADLLDERPVSRNQIVALLIDSLLDYCVAFETSGFAPIRIQWQRLHAYQDQLVELSSVEKVVRGVARGVSEHGELCLETDSGIIHFNSGEVSLRPASEPKQA